MRAFVAVECPPPIQARLGAIVEDLKVSGPRVSWVRPENMHLTLRFLGDVREEQLHQLQALLRERLPGVGSLRLCLDRLGAFPNVRRPAVLWAGLGCVGGDLEGIQAEVERAARAIDLEPEPKAFHPHITLGRIRDRRALASLPERMAQWGNPDAPSAFGVDDAFEARHVVLFESQLSPRGARYTPLEAFSLE